MSIPPRPFVIISVLVGTILLLSSSIQKPADAHDAATGVIKERMMAMESLGKATKRIAGMVNGQTDYDGEELSRLAASVSASGGKPLTELFPHGSLDKPTEALPVIWEKWDRFSELAAALSAQADGLSEAITESPESARQAFMGLAKTCKDCHGEFRLKK